MFPISSPSHGVNLSWASVTSVWIQDKETLSLPVFILQDNYKNAFINLNVSSAVF